MSRTLGILADMESIDPPFWGGAGTMSYKILFAVHITAIIAAFGPPFLSMALNREAIKRTGDQAKAFASIPLQITQRTLPPFIVAVLAGIGLVSDSGGLYKFEQQWVSIAFSLVLVLVLVNWLLVIPAQRRFVEAVQAGTAEEHAASPDIRSSKAAVAMGTGLVHLCMVALIVLMVWKPGL